MRKTVASSVVVPGILTDIIAGVAVVHTTRVTFRSQKMRHHKTRLRSLGFLERCVLPSKLALDDGALSDMMGIQFQLAGAYIRLVALEMDFRARSSAFRAHPATLTRCWGRWG